MTPDDLLSLKLRFAEATYLAEMYRVEAARLTLELHAAARESTSPGFTPVPTGSRAAEDGPESPLMCARAAGSFDGEDDRFIASLFSRDGVAQRLIQEAVTRDRRKEIDEQNEGGVA